MIQKTVYYIGNYEKEIRDNHIYHRIQIGDVAIVEKVDDNAESVNYTLRDHLGSLIATVSDTGTIKRLFYDPWGKRLNLPVLEAQPLTLFDLASFLTPRGFTGHEHLDNVGLIHMNGRVYDPEIARFVSADPILSAPTYLQSYNRYSYVWNNPLRMTDPSGYWGLSNLVHSIVDSVVHPIEHIVEHVKDTRDTVNNVYDHVEEFVSDNTDTIGSLAAIYLDAVGCSGYCSAAWSAYQAKESGASDRNIFAAALYSYSSYQLGGYYDSNKITGMTDIAQRSFTRGVINGTYSKAMGGEFEKGFYCGALSQGASDSMQYFIESNNPQLVGGAKPTLSPGDKGWDSQKYAKGYNISSTRYNNIGMAHSDLATSWMQEGSPFMAATNKIPGMNYMAAFHDTWAGTAGLSTGWTVATIAPAIPITYSIFGAKIANNNYLNSLY